MSVSSYGADTEVQDLTDISSPAVGDDMYIVDDPDGTPASKKINIGALLDVAGALDSSGNLVTDSVGTVALNASAVESELEAVLDLQDLQGAVTDAQIPDSVTTDGWVMGNFNATTLIATTVTANLVGDVTGTLTGNADTVTNGVYTTDDYFITNSASDTMTGLMTATGGFITTASITIDSDSSKLYLGADQDASTYFDGTSLWFDDGTRSLTLEAISDGLGGGVGTGDLKADGTVPLTANWDVGNFNITTDAVITSASSTFNTMVIGSGTITDSTGTISFGNESLVTTGASSFGNITGTDILATGESTLIGLIRVGPIATNYTLPSTTGTGVMVNNGAGAVSFDTDLSITSLISTGSITIDADNKALYVGADQDASIYYDATLGGLVLDDPVLVHSNSTFSVGGTSTVSFGIVVNSPCVVYKLTSSSCAKCCVDVGYTHACATFTCP